MMIQPGENEVLLSFFEVIPPFVVGNEEQVKNLQEEGVTAECIARITIAKEKFAEFGRAMQESVEAMKAQSIKEQTVQKDANDKRDNPETP